MRSVLKAAQLMWTLHRNLLAEQNSAQLHTLKIGRTHYRYALYGPHVRCKGTIAVVHGMSPKGIDDPRIVVLSQALSQAGYRVVVPEIHAIKALQIDARQVQCLAEVLHAIACTPALSPSGKISVLAPSFSGGLSIAAAARPELREQVTAICAIGAFTHVDSVMNYLLTNQNADQYGMYIVLKKILPLVSTHTAVLEKALDAAIADNLGADETQLNAQAASLQSYLATLTDHDRQAVQQILDNADYRLQLFELSRKAMAEEIRQLDIASQIDDLHARVFLLHGQEDKVIPSSQSRLLHRKLKQHRKDVNLVISPFISHGDTRFSLMRLYDVVRLVNGFAFFLQAMEHTAPAPHSQESANAL